MAQNRIPAPKQGQRALALALLLLPLLVVYFVVIAPYRQLLADKRERIADLTFQLERLRRITSREPLWKKRLQSLKEAQRRNHHYLTGTTTALASAELQEHLREIIHQAGGEITSTQVLATKPDGAFSKISVRIRFSTDTPSLREILHGIESDQPLLQIESMNIRPLRGRRRSRKTRKIILVDKLNVDMVVTGYMATPGS